MGRRWGGFASEIDVDRVNVSDSNRSVEQVIKVSDSNMFCYTFA